MATPRRFAPLALAAVLIACEDSTGPGPIDFRLAATVFDALTRSRIEAGDGFGATASRHVALALRSGVRPTRVSITVDGATEQYWALEVEHALGDDATQGPLALPLVMRSMTAWRGARPERVISVTVAGDTGTFSFFLDPLQVPDVPPERPLLFAMSMGTMFEGGNAVLFATEGGARSTRQSIGGSCPVPRPPSMSQLILPVAAPTACNRASFFTRFNMRVLEGPVPGAVATRARVVQMDGHEIAGIRLEYPPLPTLCPVCGG